MPASNLSARQSVLHCCPGAYRWFGVATRLLVMVVGLTSCTQSLSPHDAADPYLWLEASVDEPQLERWLAAQQRLTSNWLDTQAAYAPIHQQLTETWSHARWRVADIRQEQVFYFHNAGFDDQYQLYQQAFADFITGGAAAQIPGPDARLLIGSDALESAELIRVAVSPDGQRLAYQLEHVHDDGTRIQLWYQQALASWQAPSAKSPMAVSTETGLWPAETFVWAAGDTGGLGFFTVSVQEPGTGDWKSRVYRQEGANTPPQLMYQSPRGTLINELHSVGKSESDEQQLLISLRPETDGNPSGYWQSLFLSEKGLNAEIRHELDIEQGSNSPAVRYIGAQGDDLLFLVPGPGGNGQIIRADTGSVMVAETDMPLLNAVSTERGLVLEYLKHGSSSLRMILPDAGTYESATAMLELPVPVRLDDFRIVEGSHEQILLSYSGLLIPPRSELINLNTGVRQLLRRDDPAFNADLFSVHFQQIVSEDGTAVPAYVAGPASWIADLGDGQRDTNETDAGAGVLLEVYGGFGMPMETGFSISRLAWMQLGGIYVVAGPRGGGDYGPQWHLRGQAEYRANSVNDVQAVANWVQQQGWAEDNTLALTGRSHGGLLAAEVVQQNPEGFAALITDSAVLDLERLTKMGGDPRWQREYAGIESSPYSRLLQSAAGLHPPVLLVTRLRDETVAPAHSFKYYAALHSRHGEKTLLSVVGGEGHDSAGQVTELIDDYALRWAFLRAHMLSE